MTIDSTDSALLTRFVREGSEGAFAELVGMHQAMVVGTALRRTGDAEMARDVAQQVFALLARKAAWLAGRQSVAGWLHHAANFLSIRAMRGEARARARHAELARDVEERPGDSERWAALEDALTSLGATEREALVLHYFEDRGYAEMAAQLGLSEAAARKRVSRALQSLGTQLRRRGVAAPVGTVLAGAAALQTTVPAQAGLATLALAPAAAPLPVALTLSTIMSHSAVKIAVAAVVLAAVPAALTYRTNARLRAEIVAPGPASVSPTRSAQSAKPPGDLDQQNQEIAATWQQLQAEQARRMAAEDKLADLQRQVDRARSEVVVSYGQIEDLARQAARDARRWLELGNRMSHLDAAGRAQLEKEIAGTTATDIGNMLVTEREVKALERDPDKIARFYATLYGEAADLTREKTEAIERITRDRFTTMRASGLTAAQRPSDADAAWDEARQRTLSEFFDALHAIIPPDKREQIRTMEFFPFANSGAAK
jgi:RNA polymerase sigma factor (sigma-70 family)